MQQPVPKAHRENEAFFALAETASTLVALIQGEKLIYVNPATCRILGISKEQAIGHNFWDFVAPSDRQAAKQRGLARQAGIPQPTRFVERLVHADGHDVWFDYSVDVIELNGRVTTLVTGLDITDRKRMEDALRQSESLFRNLYACTPVMMCAIDKDRRFREVSNYGLRQMGRARQEIIGTRIADILTEESRGRFEDLIQRGSCVDHLPLQGVRPDGSIFDVVLSSVPRLDERGELEGWVLVAIDVTEQKRAERLLKDREAKLAEAQRIAHVGSWEWDIPNNGVTWSEEMHRVFGVRPRDVSPSYEHYLGLVHPDDREAVRSEIEQALREGKPFQSIRRIVRPDGEVRTVLTRGEVFRDAAGKPARMAGTCQDITEQRRAEELLRENEARYRSLVEHAPEAIIVGDADTGKFVDANGPALTLFGMSREDLLRLGPVDCSPPFQPNGRPSRAMAEEYIARALQGEALIFDWVHWGASRREIICQIFLARLPAAGRNLVRASIRDVTNQKRIEENMRHQEKMAAIGVLAAGVAHEIGNPLLALTMAAQNLERRLTDDYAKKKLALVSEHIERISKIVRQMSDLSRPQCQHRAACSVNRILERAIEIVRYDKRAENVSIALELATDLPSVPAVEDQIMQVCLNLLLNALDAVGANPPDRARRLTVRTRLDGDRVRVEVCDSGPGISEEARDKIFQPFFTTKDVGRGTGLGLSVSYNIIREHGGALEFESRTGEETRFTFGLPTK